MRYLLIALVLAGWAWARPALAQDGAQSGAPAQPAPGAQAAQALLPVAADTVYIPAQAYFPCRVLLPEGYDAARAYPLVIGLHGFGSDLDRFATLWYALDDPQFILAVPQAPYAIPPVDGGGASWLPKEDIDAARWEEAAGWVELYIQSVALSLRQQYKVDAAYLFGFSQGGMLAYAFSLAHPDAFAGVAGVGAVLPPDWASAEQLAAAQGVRVFIAHSPADDAIPLELAQATRDRLAGAGLAVEYHEYEGGHTFTPEVLGWFAAWLAGGAAD